MKRSRTTRRGVLGGAVGACAVALAGCREGDDSGDDEDERGSGVADRSGGDETGDGESGGGDAVGAGDDEDGEPVSVSVGVPGEDTITGRTGQSFEAVVRDESDRLRWQTRETGGDPASLRTYDRGRIDALTCGNFTFTRAMTDRGPFADDPIEALPFQGFHVATLHCYWLAVEGSGVETTDDLVDADVWPLPPAWGLRGLIEEVAEAAGLWTEMEPNVVDADVGEIADRIQAGAVDALVGYGSNFLALPGWLTVIDTRTDLHVVETTGEFATAIEDTLGTTPETIEPCGWNQNVGDSAVSVPSDFQLHLGRRLPAAIGREVARISHDHHEGIRIGQAAYPDHSDPAAMTDAYVEDHPVHPGVAAFLDEEGVWDESWERGEVDPTVGQDGQDGPAVEGETDG